MTGEENSPKANEVGWYTVQFIQLR